MRFGVLSEHPPHRLAAEASGDTHRPPHDTLEGAARADRARFAARGKSTDTARAPLVDHRDAEGEPELAQRVPDMLGPPAGR
jgi:hypothetical protein